MSAYADAIPQPPESLTEVEQAALLRVTGQHCDGFRDHVIYSLALGTALREHEIAALDVGDVIHPPDEANPNGRVRRRIPLRVFKRSSKDPAKQEVFVPDSTWYKLNKYVVWKHSRGESVELAAPLFVSRLGRRIATRTLRFRFALWQQRAGFDRIFNFHALRHYADLRVMPHPGRCVGLAEEVVEMHAALSDAATSPERLAGARQTSVIGRGPMASPRRRQ